MKQRYLIAINIFTFCLLLIALNGVQSSLWQNIFFTLPGPSFWLILTTYWGLNKELPEGLTLVYLSSLVSIQFSEVPFGVILALQLTVLFSSRALKERVFWTGTSYILLATTGNHIIVHILRPILSWIFEPKGISDFYFFKFFLQMAYFPILVPTIWFICRTIDRVSKQERLTAAEREIGRI
jgi:hypothetical protein